MLKRIDLTRDYQKHKAEYLEAIQKVCEDTAFSGGKYADEFDKEFAQYCGVPYASGVNNGTSALHCAMVALGIGEGDEVICQYLYCDCLGCDLYGGDSGICGLYCGYLGNRPG